MALDFNDDDISVNLREIFDGFDISHTALQLAVNSATATDPGSEVVAPVPSMAQEQTAMLNQQPLAVSYAMTLCGTSAQTSEYSSALQQQQSRDIPDFNDGQTLQQFLDQIPGGVSSVGGETFLQQVSGNMTESQCGAVTGNTSQSPVTDSVTSLTNSNNDCPSYTVTQSNSSEGMDVTESTQMGDPSTLNIQDFGDHNSTILNQPSVVSDLPADFSTIDHTHQCENIGSWTSNPSPLTLQSTAVLAQGLDQFQQDIHVYYNADVVTLDGSSSTDTGMDMNTEQSAGEDTRPTTDIINQARARRKTRRNRSRHSESSADVDAPEYQEFLKSLTGEARKRELNRQAAKRCRDKKFKEEKLLEEKAATLRRENNKLKAERARLQVEAKNIVDNLKHRNSAHTRQVSAFF